MQVIWKTPKITGELSCWHVSEQFRADPRWDSTSWDNPEDKVQNLEWQNSIKSLKAATALFHLTKCFLLVFYSLPTKHWKKLWTLKRLHCADVAIVFQQRMPAIGAYRVIKGWVTASCEIGSVTTATSPCLIVNVLKLTESWCQADTVQKQKTWACHECSHDCHSGRRTALWTSQGNELLSQMWVISLQHAQPCYEVM